jgi:hypothetical protein
MKLKARGRWNYRVLFTQPDIGGCLALTTLESLACSSTSAVHYAYYGGYYDYGGCISGIGALYKRMVACEDGFQFKLEASDEVMVLMDIDAFNLTVLYPQY